MKPVKVVLFHLAKFKEVHACCLNKTLRQLDQKSLINLEDINLLLGLSLINRSTVKSPFVVSKMTDIFCFLLIKIKQLYIKASQKDICRLWRCVVFDVQFMPEVCESYLNCS